MAGAVDLGSVYADLDLRTKNFERGIDNASQSMNKLASKTRASGLEMGSALENVAKTGLAILGAATIATTALIVKNIDTAIKRVDTLNNSSRTFKNMGIAGEDADKALKNLNDSILGLPTSLDSAVRGMTALTATYGDVNQGQEIFSALNNAIIGFGGTADMVNNAVLQLSQMPMDGPLDGQTWRSLRNSGLTPVLRALSEDMGMSVSDFQKALSSGDLTVRDFTEALVKMDKEGAGGMASLQTIAKDATKGIGTSIANMNTAIARGIANFIEAVGSEDIANAITNIGKFFEQSSKYAISFFEFLKRNKDVVLPIAVAFGTFIATVTAFFVAIKVGTAIMAVFNATLLANPIILITTLVLALGAGLAYFFTKTETGRKVWEKLTEAFNKFWTAIEPIRNFIGDQFISIWESLKSIWTQLVTAMQPLIDLFKEFWSKHGDKVLTVLKYIGIAIGAIAIAPLVAGFALLMGALKLVAVVLGFVARHFDTIKKIVLVILAVVFAPLIIAVGLVVGAFKLIPPVLEWVWGVMQSVWNFFVEAWNAIYGVVAPIIETLVNILTTMFEIWWNVVSFTLELIKNLFIIVFGTIAIVVLTILNKVFGFFQTIFNAIWGFIKPIITTIKDWIVGAWNTVSETTSKVFNAIWNFIKDIWDKIYGAISGVVQKIIDFFAPALTWLIEKGKDIVRGLIDGIKAMANAVWEAIKFVADKIGEFFSGVGTWLFDSGKALFQGFIDGMKNIGNKVKETAENIVGAVRDLLPFSPAKDGPFSGKGWTEYSGMALMEGLAKGMKKASDAPRLAMEQALSRTSLQMGADVSGIADNGISQDVFHIGKIELPNVQNADDFAQELKLKMSSMRGIA